LEDDDQYYFKTSTDRIHLKTTEEMQFIH